MKKLFSMLLAVILVLSSFGTVYAEEYYDELYTEEYYVEENYEPSDWAVEYVDRADKLGIYNNYNARDFTLPITRLDFCDMILDYIDIKGKSKELTGYEYTYDAIINYVDAEAGYAETIYSDEEFDDYNKIRMELYQIASMKILCDAGIITGKDNGDYAPYDSLTREEAAVIIYRLVNKTTPMTMTMRYYAFDDESDISDWSAEAIQAVCNMGIMSGTGSGMFSPQKVYSFEQAVATLVKTYDAQGTYIINNFKDTVLSDEMIEISDFYVDEAIRLSEKISSNNISDLIDGELYDNNLNKNFSDLTAIDYESPKNIYCVKLYRDKFIGLAREEIENGAESPEFESILEMIENSELSHNLVTLFSFGISGSGTMLPMIFKNYQAYVRPDDFDANFALFMEYDKYSFLTLFENAGDDAIIATCNFVNNEALRERAIMSMSDFDDRDAECVYIAKVKTR